MMGNTEQSITITEKKLVLRDYWQIFLRRKWIIIIPIIVLPAIIIPLSYLMTPVYRATTTLISQEISPRSFLKDVTDVPRGEQLSTIRYKIQSRANMKEVAEKVGLEQYLISAGKAHKVDDQVRYLRNIVRVRSLGGLVIEISVTHPISEMAKNIADVVARNYINTTLEWRQESASISTKFLSDELENYRRKLNEAEQALASAQEKGILEGTDENNPLVTDVAKLRTDLFEVEMDLQEANAELKNASKNIGGIDSVDLSILYARDPEYNRLQKELNNLESLYKQQSVRYTDDYPTLRKIKAQIEQTKSELEQLKSKIDILQEDYKTRTKYWSERVKNLELKRKFLNDKINEYEQKLQKLPKRQIEITRLQREKAVAESIYTMLLQKLNEVELSKSSEVNRLGSVAEILDPAIEPDKPISPNRKKITMMAFALGIGVGFSITFLLEYFNRSFRSVDEVVSYFGIPVLATIPKLITADSEAQAKRRKRILIVSIVSLVLIALIIIAEVFFAWFLDRNSIFINIFNRFLDLMRKFLNRY